MFDGDVTTYTDATTRERLGHRQAAPTARGHVRHRAGFTRARRSSAARNGTVLQGSNDGGATWQTFVDDHGHHRRGVVHLPACRRTRTPRLRVLDEHGGNVNIAEVQLLHDDR